MTSIFSRIIAREIPCYRIYEDEYTIAFLDIHPLEEGHTLIVPKIEIDYFYDVPEPYYSAVFATAKRIAPVIREVTGCTRIGTMTLGWDIPHFHYHLIPLFHTGGIDIHDTKSISDIRMREICTAIVQRLAV